MSRRLVDLVEAGRISDEAGLKRAFRGLAKRIHPDLALATPEAAKIDDGAAFIALRADYEAALARLAAQIGRHVAAPPASPTPEWKVTPLAYSSRQYYETFQELLARGFPRMPGRRWPNGPRERYEATRLAFLGLLAGRDQVEPSGKALLAFLAFESAWVDLALSDPNGLSAEVRLAHGLRNLLLNIVGYHAQGVQQPLRYARNECPRLETELRTRGETRPLAFLDILMADLAAGPACVDD